MNIILAIGISIVLGFQDNFPFDVKMLSKDLFICERGAGKAALRLHIDKQGEIVSYDVLTFRFSGKKKKYNFDVPYSIAPSEIRYPTIIKSNEKFFKDYVKSKIIIKKVSEDNVQEDNSYLITVNLK